MSQKLLFFVVIFLVSCSTSEQPTEIEKSLIEKKILNCMVAVNTQRGIPEETEGLDFGALADLGASLSELAEDSSPTKQVEKSWRVEGENENRKISMMFDIKDKSFQCDFEKKNAEWELYEVKRNGEIVFNLIEDQSAKAENKRLGEELKAKKIKQWSEKSYSNVSYKYYQKRHVNSDSGFMEPVLKVNCKPDDTPYIIYDHGGFTGKESIDLSITMKSGEINNSLTNIALDQYGYMGKIVKEEYSFGINTDRSTSLMLAKKASDISSVELEGFTFNFDDISQVPCLVN